MASLDTAHETDRPPSRRAGLAAFVPRLVVDWSRQQRARWWQREGSMVSADISGFTRLSERLATLGNEGAEELTDLINECFDGMIDIAAEHGGDVLKFGGDALLLFFSGPGHAERACAAAVGMRASIARPLRTRSVTRVRLEMSQGIHSGRFELFVVDAGHSELLVTGPGATATVECEATAEAGEILLSDAAAAEVPASWLGPARPGGRLLRQVGDVAPYLDLAAAHEAADVEGLIAAGQREQIEAGVGGEHRRVTTAFVKFSHVDELIAGPGAEEVARRLDLLAASVRQAVERHGVHWLATDIAPDGGKVILTAGAPVSARDDEERMLRAAHDIVAADPGLHLRAGVHAGHVFAGIVGSRRRRAYTVMGDAVNLAARLMQRAEAGEVLATAYTLQQSSVPFATEPLEPFHVKGKEAPIEAARVGAPRAAVPRSAPGDDDPPFVGRDAEVRRIAEAVAAAGSETVVVDVVGEVGIGKSRLLAELRRALPDHVRLGAAGGPYASATPYLALRDALRALTGVPADATREEAGGLLTETVVRTAPGLLSWLPLLAVPLDALVGSTPEVDMLAPAFRRASLHAAVRELLESLPGGPLLVTIDDAHWLDEASADLVRSWTSLRRPAGALVVVAREPGEPVVAPDTAMAMPLDALDRRSTEQLVMAASHHDLLPDVVHSLADHSGGRPLFVIELARAAGASGAGDLPDSIESLVTARIDTLPASARRLLRELSVLGEDVDVGLAAVAFDVDGTDGATWDALDGFLVDAGDGHRRFRHSTYQAVAYAGLPFRRRRELHERVGRALERRAHDGADDAALSLHFHRAQVGVETWRYSLSAGEHARHQYANVEAAEHFRRALDGAAWARHVPLAHVRDTWTALGDVCELSARYEEAAAAYAAAGRIPAGDPLRDVELAQRRGVVCERSGQYSNALRWYSRGLKRTAGLAERDRTAASAALARAYAGVRYRQGRWADCVRWAKRAADDAAAADDRNGLAHAWYLLDIALSSIGSPEAAEYRGRALPVFEELGDLVGQANALNNDGVTAYYESRWDEAVDCYQRSQRARTKAGDVVGAATQVNNLGEVLSDQGHLDAATERFEEALRVWRAANYPVGIAVALSNLGRAAARRGDAARALELLDDARRRCEALGAAALGIEAEVRVVEALVLSGRHDEALPLVAPLAARLRQGEGDDLLGAILDRLHGWALLRTGDVEAAAAALAASLERGEALGARFEVALTQLATAQLPTSDDGARRAHEETGHAILDELGVVSVPPVP